jgi:Rod binding domain-containing protein
MSVTAPGNLPGSTPQPTTENQKKAWKASQDFEAIMLRQLFQSMRNATAAMTDEQGENGSEQQMSMAWDGMADQVAHSGGMGLAKILYPQLLSQAERGEMQQVPSSPIVPATNNLAIAANQYLKSSHSVLTPDTLARAVAKASAETGLPQDLLKGVIHTESGGNPMAKSPKGATGLMQLMPATAKELGVDPTDPVQNILGGARYLAQMKKRFGSDTLALAAYNAGPGAVDAHGGVPPYRETQDYVKRVTEAREKFRGAK